LVLAISSDALFTMAEQKDMVSHLPEAKLVVVESPEGHDGFLLEFEQINSHILQHLHERLPEIYQGEPLVTIDEAEEDVESKFAVKKDSVFGEAEADVTAW
jgi:homoserine O-acetyltransferase